MDETKETKPTNETGVTGDNYASMLRDAIKAKDAQIAEIEAAAEKRTRELTETILNGKQVQEEPVKVEVLKSRKELYEEYQKIPAGERDLNFWTKFLELRDATIRETGKDPCVTGSFGFGPNGTVQPAYGEAESINQTMATIKELIDDAKGDPDIFRAKFASIYR